GHPAEVQQRADIPVGNRRDRGRTGHRPETRLTLAVNPCPLFTRFASESAPHAVPTPLAVPGAQGPGPLQSPSSPPLVCAVVVADRDGLSRSLHLPGEFLPRAAACPTHPPRVWTVVRRS